MKGITLTDIRDGLKSRGIKMKEFAAALGVSKSVLSQWMNGHKIPGHITMTAIRLVYVMQFKNKPKKS